MKRENALRKNMKNREHAVTLVIIIALMLLASVSLLGVASCSAELEIAYDDGEMDSGGSFGSNSGWGHGVLFDVGAPTTVTKVKIYGHIYDAKPPFVPPGFGQKFDIEIRDSSRNKLNSFTYDYDDYFTESYDWTIIDIPDVTVDDDFYIWVNTKSFQSPEIGKDVSIGEDSDSPIGNSFKIETTTNSILETWDSNWMIRAVVDITVTEEEKSDLTITDIWRDKENPKIGDEVTFSYTVKNQGAVDTPSEFNNLLYIDGKRWDLSARGSLAAGESQDRFFTHTWKATAGDHTIKVVADGFGEIDESDETNNASIKTLEIVNLADSLTVTEVDDGVIIETSRVKYYLANGGFAKELWVDHDGDGIYDEDIGFWDSTCWYNWAGFGSWYVYKYTDGKSFINGSICNGIYSWEILEISDDKAVVEFTNEFSHVTAKTRWEIYPDGDAKVTPWTMDPLEYTYGITFTWWVSPHKDDVVGMRLSPDVEVTSTVTFTGSSSEIAGPSDYGTWMKRPKADFSDISYTHPYQFYSDKTHSYTVLIVEPKASKEEDWEWIESPQANDAIWGGRLSHDDPSNPLYYGAGLVDWCWYADHAPEEGGYSEPLEAPTTQPINQDNKFSFYVHWMWEDTTESERYEAAGEIAEMLAESKVVQDLTHLTDGPYPEYAPSWSPDGIKIAFNSHRSYSSGEVWLMNADGSNQVAIPNTIHGAIFVNTWNIDGTKVTL